MKNNISIRDLGNGVRLVHQQIRHTQLVHCGVMVRAGSRDETLENNGVAHFIEHAVFKGTQKRKAYHILNLIESVGGELNAYTTRENTCFYTSSLKRYLDRDLDLLSDIVLNSRFEPKELERERSVIEEEIEMYLDNPDESVYDDFVEMLFEDSPLGFNILGSPESLRRIGRDQMLQFISQHYTSQRFVISICGNVSLSKAINLAQKWFGEAKLQQGMVHRETPSSPATFQKELAKDYTQSYCTMGVQAYSRFDDRRFGLMVLCNLLGGAGMSSRLNLTVREKYGLTYNIGSSYSAFDDSGMFSTSFSCDDKHMDRCISLTKREFRKLREQRLGKLQLAQAKRQVQGQLAMAAENPSVLMQSNAKSLLNFDSVRTLDDILRSIDEVDAAQIQDIANELLVEEQNILIYRNK